eukprot:1142203_1
MVKMFKNPFKLRGKKDSSKHKIDESGQADMDVEMEDPGASMHNRDIEEKITQHARAKRAQNVFAPPVDITEDFVIPVYPKSEASIQFIDNSLADNFIFASLSDSERRNLIDAMVMEKVT